MNDQTKSNNNTIHYIELPLVDVEATKKFYGDVFGWRFTQWGDDYISFEGAGIDGGFNREEGVYPAAPGALIILYADDLEAKYKEIVKAGGKIVKEIFSFPGGRRFHFMDPNENQLAVWTITPT